ncbi:MAG: phosphatase PAP2 family protein [Bacteroidota bacterium]
MVSLSILFLINKGDILIIINGNHDPYQDFIFRFTTHLGDGLILLFVLGITLLLKNRFYVFTLISSSILHGVVILILKRTFFPDAPRPIAYLKDSLALHFIEEVEVHSARSFPSGHTATAFVVAVFLSFLFRKQSIALLLLSFAIIVGYSRIYLLQHFYLDTVFGALVGTLSVFISYTIVSIFYLKNTSHFKYFKAFTKHGRSFKYSNNWLQILSTKNEDKMREK